MHRADHSKHYIQTRKYSIMRRLFWAFFETSSMNTDDKGFREGFAREQEGIIVVVGYKWTGKMLKKPDEL